ncbi:hypothetical protein ['Paenibacillus yunnanensis' Narsing Rao et al. 2020]|uniref:hypothetical protein n=1 Tax=Paenibacillus tengchongensis TaxID=2608684 RepID=UPI00165206B6|nr:hypothetical protein [Paenibacillus tengchongensis]
MRQSQKAWTLGRASAAAASGTAETLASAKEAAELQELQLLSGWRRTLLPRA